MHEAIIITDLTFGDAGKGTITDALVRRGAELVVRYNGGAQAAHTVIDADGNSHIFHQFGSGTLVDRVETFLSRFMLVNPLALHYEEIALHELGFSDAADRMHIDGEALVTTPFHMVANQLKELARGDNRHGSCGLGIGETASDGLDYEKEVLRFGDLRQEAVLQQKLLWQRDLKRRQLRPLEQRLEKLERETVRKMTSLLDQLHSHDEMEATLEVFGAIAERYLTAPPNFLAERLARPACTLFEGAQGVLLDENWGFHPYTTWSTTTPHNALQLVEEAGGAVETTILGLTRAYQTRHGAGPFPTESEEVTMALPEPHNPTNPWQGPFRAGWLDLSLLRYAVQISGRIDGLVMTCLDRLESLPKPQIGVGYKLGHQTWELDKNPTGGLDQRERDGQCLSEAEVQYEPVEAEPFAYAEYVASSLGLPLLGTSSGPTAEDKTFFFAEAPLTLRYR